MGPLLAKLRGLPVWVSPHPFPARRQGRSQFPPWLMSIAESIAGKTHVWKALKELELETKKQKMAKMKAQAAADEEEKAALKSELAELRAAQAASEAKLAAMLEELSNVNRGDDPSTRA